MNKAHLAISTFFAICILFIYLGAGNYHSSQINPQTNKHCNGDARDPVISQLTILQDNLNFENLLVPNEYFSDMYIGSLSQE
jgi:hypothetical protein